MQQSIHGHAILFEKVPFMNSRSTPDPIIIDHELITNLLNELNSLFQLFKDGIVRDDTFVGGLPLSYLNTDGSLGALTLEDSRQIRGLPLHQRVLSTLP